MRLEGRGKERILPAYVSSSMLETKLQPRRKCILWETFHDSFTTFASGSCT